MSISSSCLSVLSGSVSFPYEWVLDDTPDLSSSNAELARSSESASVISESTVVNLTDLHISFLAIMCDFIPLSMVSIIVFCGSDVLISSSL